MSEISDNVAQEDSDHQNDEALAKFRVWPVALPVQVLPNTKDFLVAVILVLMLVACTPTAAPPTYKGLTLPTPPPRAENEPLPPAWLIVQDKAVPGTLFSYHLSSGQELGGPPAQEVELAMAAFAVGEQVVIVAPTSITTFQARFVIDVPAGPTARYLKAEGKTEGDAAIFTLEQTGYTDDQFLLARLEFEGQVSGEVEYIWTLTNPKGSAPTTPTPVASAGAPPCERPANIPPPTATPVGALTPDPDWEELLRQTSPEALAPDAQLIILGTVVGPAVGLGPPHRLVTDTAVQVECFVKGAPSGATLIVRTEGGCPAEGDCMFVSHGAQLTVGQRVVLFLQHIGPEYVTVRGEDGRYEIQAGPDYYSVTAEDGNYTVVGDRATTARHEYSLAGLMARIDSAKR